MKFYVGKRLFRRAFRQFARPALSGTVLDLGSGTSPYAGELPGCRIVTLEREHRFCPTVVGSAQALPFAAASFDGVICTEVLEHLSEPGTALSEINRILKPGGHVYITTPMTWYLHYEPHDYFRFTPYGLKYLLEQHRFGIVSLVPLGGLSAVLTMVILEKVFNLCFKCLFFVPKAGRLPVLAVVFVPVSWVIAHATNVLDHFSKRWAYSVCALAAKRAEPVGAERP